MPPTLAPSGLTEAARLLRPAGGWMASAEGAKGEGDVRGRGGTPGGGGTGETRGMGAARGAVAVAVVGSVAALQLGLAVVSVMRTLGW